MSRCAFVWAHALQSSRAHEDELGLFDWSEVEKVSRVVRYDARGHGTTEPTQYDERAYRWPALVDDMMRHAGTGPYVAGGTSMGCATALYAALRGPRRVQGLVLALPPTAWEAREEVADAYRTAAAIVERRGLEHYVDVLRRTPQAQILADEVPEAREVQLRHLASMDEKVVPAILRGAAASDLPSCEDVRSIVVPTLILGWEGDPGHPLATVEKLSELLVLSEVDVARNLDDVGRWPLLVRDFLAGICQWE